jgi:hypothetical protein
VNSNLIWDDTRVSIEGISELKSFQRYNHFPAMSEISKKDALGTFVFLPLLTLPLSISSYYLVPSDLCSTQHTQAAKANATGL